MTSEPQKDSPQQATKPQVATTHTETASVQSFNKGQDNSMLVTWPTRATGSSSASHSYVSSSRVSTPRTETTDTDRKDWSDRMGKKQDATSKNARSTGTKRLWEHVKGWVTTNEPSTQALRDHKKATFQKAGISMDDPRASARLHLPAGEIPEEAIRPTGPGPDPEEIVEKKKRDRQQVRDALGGQAHGDGCKHSRSHSHSTCSVADSQRSSVKAASSNSVTPWEVQGKSPGSGTKSNSS